MLYPKQTNCTECGNIDSLLKDIDCKLAQLSNTMYNNIVFMLNKTISGTAIFDLLQYKRILYYKQINPDYACNYSVNMITSKVKLLASNCVKNCFDAPPIKVTTTTTTTPCPTTTTTTSSSTTTTTSTSTTTTTTSTTTSTTTTTTTTCYICLDNDLVIGTQTWASCNLNVTSYQNGDPIPEVTDPTAWAGLTTGAWCHYVNISANGVIYGKLYNWYAVNDIRGIGPVGYHIPTNAEYTTLTTFLGGTGVAGGELKLDQGDCYWDLPNVGATNSVGFSALPGGVRSGTLGIFLSLNADGYWWCSNLFNPSEAYVFSLSSNVANSNSFNRVFSFGCSIRLIKD